MFLCDNNYVDAFACPLRERSLVVAMTANLAANHWFLHDELERSRNQNISHYHAMIFNTVRRVLSLVSRDFVIKRYLGPECLGFDFHFPPTGPRAHAVLVVKARLPINGLGYNFNRRLGEVECSGGSAEKVQRNLNERMSYPRFPLCPVQEGFLPVDHH